MATTARHCEVCQKPLGADGQRQTRFCSRVCQRLGGYVSTLPRELHPSPLHWNGHSTYSDTGALREPYRVVCLLGGHQSGVYLLTRQRAALVRTAGLPRCGVCQSWCYLEPDSDMPSRRAAVKEHHASGLGTVEA